MVLEIRLIKKLIMLDLEAYSPVEILEKIAQRASKAGLVKSTWLKAVIKRESEFPTGLPTLIPVAIPHTGSEHVISNGVGFFKLIKPVLFSEMGSLDTTVAVKMIFPLLITDPTQQVDLLMTVINALQKPDFLKDLTVATTVDEVIKIFKREGL